MKICITGGGTGGHLMIAQALAEAAQELNIETIFIGSTSGQDQKYFAHSSLFNATYFLDTTGVVNKKAFGKLFALSKVFKGFLLSIKLLRKHRIDAVISVGGFSAAPASFAALATKTPLYIHEQNAKTGKLNALLQRFSKAFFSSYDPSSSIKPYPVREIFFQTARKRKNINTIIFLGGSQGARFINNLALEIAPILDKKGIHIIHQAGEKEFQKVQQAYKKMHIDAKVYGFTNELPQLMHQADLAVSRSGASTLWELSANALPALFIPYPYAAGDHQYYNAKYLQEHNLAWIAREEENPKELLLQILESDLEEKSTQLQKLTKPGIAKEILQYIQKGVSC
jgi:UDP-N-acetylglucosamine--N-acetylmuramyl-(pentapeptide) pyrophosphoryl-undecaprenol N-acetylglucosamine transferase